jgi:putative effector of murein hydrolase/ferredoxin
MTDFVNLWVYLSATPLFGLTATLGVYVLASGHVRAAGPAALGQPGAVVGGGAGAVAARHRHGVPGLLLGAQFIHFLLGPAVVALAWPLWQRRAELRRRAVALLLAALAGGAAASGSAVAIGWAVGLPSDVIASLAPKSTTAPVAMGLAAQLGGIPALAAVFAVLTGLVGAVTAQCLLRALRVRHPAVHGFALGTVSHGIGAARALQVHPEAGAYAALALGCRCCWRPADAAAGRPLFLTSPRTFHPLHANQPGSRVQRHARGQEAEAILRKCVHCGFCTATCPTYQLLGDELDGPRGRIYLMKQVLEGAPVTRKTQQHLDRCLTCRNCETTCPSGVQFGHLVDIGRKIVDERVERPRGEKACAGCSRPG